MAPAAQSRSRSCETLPLPIPSSAHTPENPSTARRYHPRGRLELSSTARCKSKRPAGPSPVSCLTAAAPTRARGSPTTPLVQFHDVDSFFLRATIYNDASLKSHPFTENAKGWGTLRHLRGREPAELRSAWTGEGARPHTSYFLFREGFLIHHIRHLRNIAAVVAFQHVNQSLDAASGHAFVGIGRQAGDAGGAGEMGHQAAAIGDGGIAQRRIGGERLRLVNIECRAGDSFLAQGARQGGLVHHRTPRCVDDHGGALHHAQRDFVDQVVGWRRALALAQQRNVQADEIRAPQRFVQRGVANGGSLATQPEPEAQILHLLYGPDVVVILIRRGQA